jgi:ABC-type antimicrobial peptide transport system permease subunit
MEQFRTTLGEFLRDLRAQKLRTALTVFGIMWGTVAIVVLLAFGMGFKRQLSISMHEHIQAVRGIRHREAHPPHGG